MTKPKKPGKSEAKATHPASSDVRLGSDLPLGGTWLDQRLKVLYEPVIHEPLPEEMLRLLQPRKH